jgi:metal-responsive CopG/Arc/MetJ family transcriptional regulator
VRRTQLYLDDNLWQLLHAVAEESGSTVSELVRQAVREKYIQAEAREQRARAFESVIGLWKDRTDLPDTESYVRELRRGSRLERFSR